MEKNDRSLALDCEDFVCEEEEPTVYESGDFKYILLDDGTAEITGYIGTAEELAIPAELDGYTVSSIGDDAFYFRDSLTKIMIPDSVVSVGVRSFAECDHLTNIQVSPDHPVLETVDGVLFDKTEKKLICYPGAIEAKAYEIPQGIRIIGDYAFSSYCSLTQITLPDSVTAIGAKAFYSCGSLAQITIPDSVTAIGDYAFFGCSDSLTLTVGRNSCAEEYAKANDIEYTYPDPNYWLNS